jgi:hypothetical protein
MIGALTLAVIGTLFGYVHYERSRVRLEEALLDVRIDSLEIRKGASLEEALRTVVEKVHTLGHPELWLHYDPDGRDTPSFRAEAPAPFAKKIRGIPPIPGLEPAPDASEAAGTSAAAASLSGVTDRLDTELRVVRVGAVSTIVFGDDAISGQTSNALPLVPGALLEGSVTFGSLLGRLASIFNSTCTLKGHEVLAVKKPGTVREFRRARFLTYGCAKYNPDPTRFAVENELKFYEGMNVQYTKDLSEIEIYGPKDQVEFLREIMTPTDAPATRREAIEWQFYDWRQRYLGS